LDGAPQIERSSNDFPFSLCGVYGVFMDRTCLAAAAAGPCTQRTHIAINCEVSIIFPSILPPSLLLSLSLSLSLCLSLSVSLRLSLLLCLGTLYEIGEVGEVVGGGSGIK